MKTDAILLLGIAFLPTPPSSLTVAQVEGTTLVIDSKEGPSPSCTSSCFQNGVVNLNGESLTLLGKYEDATLSVVLSNSKSYSRVEIKSQVFASKVGELLGFSPSFLFEKQRMWRRKMMTTRGQYAPIFFFFFFADRHCDPALDVERSSTGHSRIHSRQRDRRPGFTGRGPWYSRRDHHGSPRCRGKANSRIFGQEW